MAIDNKLSRTAQHNFAINVKIRLVELGLSVTELARRLGYARNTVSIAINHERLFKNIKKEIRKEIGL